MHLFKLWSSNRQEKYFVLVKATRGIHQELLNQATLKFKRTIEAIVLEKDGTLIDDEEILLMLKEETLVALSSGEKWMTVEASEQEPVQTPITQMPVTQSPIVTTMTISDLAELGLKNDVFEVSLEATNIKSDVSECSESTNEIYQAPIEYFDRDRTMEVIWGEFQVPWEKIPYHMLKACDEGQKTKQIITEIIHIIVYEMRQIKTNIPARAFKFVAKMLGDRYPEIFRDVDEDNVVIGDGTHSVTMKLLDRNNYLNRPHKRPYQSDPYNKYSKAMQNAQIGCSNWEPSKTGSTEHLQMALKNTQVADPNFCKLLEQTYVDQRLFFNNVNNPPTIQEIKTNWNAVLTTTGIYWHFQKLTFINLRDIIKKIRDKSARLIKFGHQKKLIASDEKDLNDTELTSIKVISKYFLEDLATVFRVCEVDNQTNLSTLPTAPSIVRFESSNNPQYAVYLQQTLINEDTYNSFAEAFAISFALYFIANLQYPSEICCTMEMVQRYYCKIHPDSGSKSRKKIGAKSRVLTLINKINNL